MNSAAAGKSVVAQALMPAVSRLVSTPVGSLDTRAETSVPRSGDATGTSARATGENSELFLDVARELLSRGHQVRFRAKGGSMHPTIRDGEAIVVEPVSPKGLKKGDIAFYQAQRGVTAHRVVGIEGGRLRMRGDATSSVEEPREPAQVLGRVVAVERRGRRIRLEGVRANLGFHIGIYWSVLKSRARNAAARLGIATASGRKIRFRVEPGPCDICAGSGVKNAPSRSRLG